MGMHFGILAANTSWAALQRKLLHRAGEVSPAGDTRDFEHLKGQNTDLFVLVAGDYAGKAYVIDESFILSMAYPDLIVALSADVGGRVVGCGAETVSGSFNMTFADNGELKRLYHHCHMAISKPFQLGDPLPCERRVGYEQLDGEGLFAALSEAGFDYQRFYENGNHSCYLFKPNDERIKEMETGSPAKRLKAHHEECKWPEGQAPQPTVVFRGIVQQPRGLWGWVRSLFGMR